MKNTFTLLVLLLTSCLLMGQNTSLDQGHTFEVKENLKKNLDQVNRLNAKQAFKSLNAIFHQLDSVIFENYNENDQSWIEDGIDVYHYNSKGLCEEVKSFSWDEEWVLVDQQSLFYDENYLLVRQVDSTLSEETGNWIPMVEFDFSYNEEQLIGEVLISYQEDMWQYYEKSDLIYDDQGRLVELIMSEKETENSPWQAYSKDGYAYDDEVFLMNEESYYLGQAEWILFSFTVNSYNENWKIQQSEYFYDEEQMQDWESQWKTEFVYDDQNNLEAELFYVIDEDSNEWLPTESSDMSYDDNVDFNNLILPVFIGGDLFIQGYDLYFNHMLLENQYSSINPNTNELELSDRERYIYSEKELQSIHHLSTLEANIYPNPASDFITFELESPNKTFILQIINLQGQVILEESIKSHQALSISKLSSGIYTYCIKDDVSIMNGKFVKN